MLIDEELLQEAHNLGLNVTKICDNASRDMIARIERPYFAQKSTKISQIISK